MRFQLPPRQATIDDLERSNFLEISRDFADLGDNKLQQVLNK